MKVMCAMSVVSVMSVVNVVNVVSVVSVVSAIAHFIAAIHSFLLRDKNVLNQFLNKFL
jgi:hypothetical protein